LSGAKLPVSITQAHCPQHGSPPFRRQVFPREPDISQQVSVERIRPFDVGLRLARTYWIVCPKAISTKPKIATFREWLLAEAADDARRLRKIFAA